MDYLKLFQTHSDYEDFVSGGTMLKPNVSHCVQENDVHYNPHTFADEYFTTIARENGTISFNIWKSMGTEYITSMSYSTDNGNTWNTTNNINNKSEHLVIDVNVSEGDKVLWKGDATQTGYYDEDDYGDAVGSFFSSTCEFDAQGNVMSLLYLDDFNKQLTLEENYAFLRLFNDYDGEKSCGIVNARNLSLPATRLTNNCYSSMFRGCTSLTTAPALPVTAMTEYCYTSMFEGCTSLIEAPELPATTLVECCYQNMFAGCTNLTSAPELPATTLASSCYDGMFQDCTNLVNAPSVLPATTLTDYCYSSMFAGCTSLTVAPELPATTLVDGCYINMFYGCTSLTTAPALPATTLANRCYSYMFEGCTSLTTAPELPATTMVNRCYWNMFAGCTSLTTAPELPATALTNSCYTDMFNGCSNLNYIKAMFTTTPSGGSPYYYTQNWVSGVASTGTFVKNSAATWDVTGVDGIPTGWTVQTASA